MKERLLLTLMIPMLSLTMDVNAQNRRDPQGPAASHEAGQQRRPAEHWLEGIRKENPEEFERLRKLRKESPESFSDELRKRIRARMTDRMLEQNPRLKAFIQTLPSDKQELLMDAFREFSAGEREGNPRNRPDTERPRHRAGAHRTPPAGDSASDAGKAPRNRTELEKTYDQRTHMIEQSIDRIRRQLEGLERMLDERKSRREEIISTSESM